MMIGVPERASHTPDPPDRCILPCHNTWRHPCKRLLANACWATTDFGDGSIIGIFE